jgi:hypothetical protein
LEYGGNDIDVTYGSTSTNLHHIWDTNMPEQYAGGYSLSDAEAWAKTLTTSIKSGTYQGNASSWLTGIDLSDAQTTSMGWATDSNIFVCTAVMPKGTSVLQGVDLSTTYYKTVLPVIELQVAKAGYRYVQVPKLLTAFKLRTLDLLLG